MNAQFSLRVLLAASSLSACRMRLSIQLLRRSRSDEECVEKARPILKGRNEILTDDHIHSVHEVRRWCSNSTWREKTESVVIIGRDAIGYDAGVT